MIFVLLAVTTFGGVALAQRNTPHPCAAVTSPMFVNDFATCESYFWCSGPGTGFPTGPCPAGHLFDEAKQACNPDTSIFCPLCPGTGIWAVSRVSNESQKPSERPNQFSGRPSWRHRLHHLSFLQRRNSWLAANCLHMLNRNAVQ